MSLRWSPPEEWVRLTAVDAHTAGEPLRIFIDGWPNLPGDTILAKRRYAHDHYDHLRRATMWAVTNCSSTPPTRCGTASSYVDG